jgi:tetratricopeptide (TPR) repeat protein
MGKVIAGLVCAFLLLAAAHPAEAYYKWRDRNGTLHLSDTPPQPGEAMPEAAPPEEDEQTPPSTPPPAPRVKSPSSSTSSPIAVPASKTAPKESKAPARPLPASPVLDPAVIVPRNLRAALEAGEYEKLDRFFEQLQAGCEMDVQREIQFQDACRAFSVAPSDWADKLDGWVRAFPGHFAPLLIRGEFHNAMGWKARGSAWAKDTPREQFEKMADYHGMALKDLFAALEINPRVGRAYQDLIEIARANGEHQLGDEAYKRGIAAVPASYLLRHARMMALLPRWGGSYEQMDTVARQAEKAIKSNPALKALKGYVDWDKGSLAAIDKDYPRAIEFYRKALSFGEAPIFRETLATACFWSNRYPEALEAIDRAIAVRPNNAAYRVSRGMTKYQMGEYGEDLAELERAEEIEPGHSEAVSHRKWASKDLMRQGHVLFNDDLGKALAFYRLAVRFDPANTEALKWRSETCRRKEGMPAAVAELKAELAKVPDSFALCKAFDDLLITERRWDEIIAAWDRYIELKPGDPEAWQERAGSKFHKGDIAGSLKDAEQACDLGSSQGCALLKKIKAKAGR